MTSCKICAGPVQQYQAGRICRACAKASSRARRGAAVRRSTASGLLTHCLMCGRRLSDWTELAWCYRCYRGATAQQRLFCPSRDPAREERIQHYQRRAERQLALFV